MLGPDFGETITILCPVGESQIKKMDKIPFIIEFWDVVTSKFLGIIKLNLGKIKKGFILNNRLNEIGIKTNLLPTTIIRGRVPLLDISESSVGSSQIYAAIGTSSQLNTHLNETANRFYETRPLSNPIAVPTNDKEQISIGKKNNPEK